MNGKTNSPLDVLAVMKGDAGDSLRYRRDCVLGNYWTPERLSAAEHASCEARAAVAELVEAARADREARMALDPEQRPVTFVSAATDARLVAALAKFGGAA